MFRHPLPLFLNSASARWSLMSVLPVHAARHNGLWVPDTILLGNCFLPALQIAALGLGCSATLRRGSCLPTLASENLHSWSTPPQVKFPHSVFPCMPARLGPMCSSRFAMWIGLRCFWPAPHNLQEFFRFMLDAPSFSNFLSPIRVGCGNRVQGVL